MDGHVYLGHEQREGGHLARSQVERGGFSLGISRCHKVQDLVPAQLCLLGSFTTVDQSQTSLFLEEEGPRDVQVTLTSQPTQATQMTQHPGVPREVRLIVQALTS